MSGNDTLKVFETLEVIRKQSEKEDEIRIKMFWILDDSEINEDEIPPNENIRISIEMLKKAEDKFSVIQKLDLDYLEVGEYICFKVDDEISGIEGIYFVSPTEVLYLESGIFL